MKKVSNLKRHIIVGVIVGFIGAIAVGFALWMEKTHGEPLSPAVVKTAIWGAVIFASITILFELLQWLFARNRIGYWKRKWLDSLMDVIVGNIAFLLPWLVITLGTYGGNVLRP